jgi:short-subunit dehydrogenase
VIRKHQSHMPGESRSIGPRKRTVLITGASSGIGEAFADAFAAEGFDLVITARREERLHAVAERIAQQRHSRVDVIPCDLRDQDAPARLCAAIEERGLIIDALVNNAGFGVSGGFTSCSWQAHAAMLQVMVCAVAELTYRLLPGMVDRRYGRIVNVASLAGVAATPAGTVYGAAKTFVVRFSQSLSREVSRHGVHVTAVCPGLTRTGFHSAADARASVAGMPRWLWMDADTVARQGVAAVMAGRTVYVNGAVNRATAAVFRFIPLPIVIAAGRRLAGAVRKA